MTEVTRWYGRKTSADIALSSGPWEHNRDIGQIARACYPIENFTFDDLDKAALTDLWTITTPEELPCE